MWNTPYPITRLVLGLLCLAVGGFSGGCGYTIGPAFSPGVRTVAVPIFQADLFRRGIEFQLTEAVQKELKLRGLQIAEAPYADTRLTGRIVSFQKKRLSESANDDPRELQLHLVTMVTWEDLRTGEILNQQEIALPPEAMAFASTSEFAPEIGQSLASANQQLVNRIARDIVNKMEMPW